MPTWSIGGCILRGRDPLDPRVVVLVVRNETNYCLYQTKSVPSNSSLELSYSMLWSGTGSRIWMVHICESPTGHELRELPLTSARQRDTLYTSRIRKMLRSSGCFFLEVFILPPSHIVTIKSRFQPTKNTTTTWDSIWHWWKVMNATTEPLCVRFVKTWSIWTAWSLRGVPTVSVRIVFHSGYSVPTDVPPATEIYSTPTILRAVAGVVAVAATVIATIRSV